MATKRKCRSCFLAKEYVMETSKHQLVDPKLICPLCSHKGKWYSHLNDELSGDALECKGCHNYIFYVIDPPHPWKDEIYIPRDSGEILVMREFEDKTTFISIDNKKVTTLNQILQFQNLDELMGRIKTIVMFS